MRRDATIAKRQKLLDRLPVTGEVLRGSLLQRTIRNHARGCAKCASGEGHPLAVLTVSYPGGGTRQFSLRRERVAEVRRWLRSEAEGDDRGDLRAQPRAAASGTGRAEAPEQAP